DFSPTAAPVQVFAGGQLTAAAPQTLKTLTVTQGQIFHFVLSATGPAGQALRMTVYDSTGRPVLTRFDAAGDTVSVDSYLAPDTSGVRLGGGARTGALQPMWFSLSGLGLSDPIGPQATDPIPPTGGTGSPPPPPPPPPGFTWTSGGTVSTVPATDPY